MDPVMVGFIVASLFFAGWVWGSLKNWLERQVKKITNWLRSQGWHKAAVKIENAWALCWQAFDAVVKIVTGARAILEGYVAKWMWGTVAEEAGKHYALFQEAEEAPPQRVRDEIKKRGVYAIER